MLFLFQKSSQGITEDTSLEEGKTKVKQINQETVNQKKDDENLNYGEKGKDLKNIQEIFLL